MTLERMYAEALFKADRTGRTDQDLLAGLKAALARRGHSALLPKIFREYEKLELEKERIEAYACVTPERERTRILHALYRSLVSSNHE